MSITLKDIAKICGVSTATVSLVISDHPRIPESTKKRVLKIIKKLGYYPHSAARALSTNRTKTICVVLPQIPHIFSDPFFGEVLSGIYDYSSKNDYRLVLEVATYEFCFYKKYLQMFKERVIDGMIYVGSTLDDRYLIDLKNENLPFILVGSYFPDVDINYVIGDNFQGGYIATKYLIQLGHRRIGYITGHFKIISAYDRFLGYKKALLDHGLQYDENLVLNADFDEITGYKAMIKLLNDRDKQSLRDKISAVFAGNDLMAIGAIRAIQERGLRIPQDISVIGMDNLPLSGFKEISLTTVEYNIRLMGEITCKKVIELIENSSKHTKPQIKEILPVKLIIRNTCSKNPFGEDTEHLFGIRKKLTEKQEKILEFVKDSMNKRGFPPTLREICKYFKFKSVATAHQYLVTLRQKGYLRFRISDESSSRRVARGVKQIVNEQITKQHKKED